VTTLSIAVVAVFAIQWLVFIPSCVARSERFFDLTGAATYVAVTVWLAVASAPLDARSWLLTVMVAAWAVRLGGFLFARVRRAGRDARFDELRTSWPRFLGVWTLQGVWITFTAAAAWVSIAVGERAPIDAWAVAGVALWIVGFTLEVVADEQKRRFKADASRAGEFITTGLWAACRHPNYLGEIVLWTGVALVAVPTLVGWQWLAILSPVFVAALLLRISGVPLLEARARERWGGRPEFERYVRETPVLVPSLRSLRRIENRRSGGKTT
jgi:steroid 5-alpha reductase family enzyme